MVIRPSRFNFNLLLLATLAVFAGCQTTDYEKLRAVVRIHLEVNPNSAGIDGSSPVPIYRADPVMVNVLKSAFLTEANIEKADVLNTLGGFALRIQFDHIATGLLEQYSSLYPGKHFAIFCQFGKKLVESRWLAAPLIDRRITSGALVFTPDCTREEADEIVLGINNTVAKRKKADWIK